MHVLAEEQILQSYAIIKEFHSHFLLPYFVEQTQDRGNCPKLQIIPSITNWTSLLEKVKIFLKFEDRDIKSCIMCDKKL